MPVLRRLTYLNAAASSPIAQPVFDACVEQLDDARQNGDLHFLTWLSRKEQVRERLARMLGAASADVAFLSSTSMGFHLVAQALRARGVKEVVTLAGEFPSTTLPLLHAGIRLKVVEPRADGTYAVDDLERAVSGRTGALALSAVQYASGFRIDLEAVRALARQKGLLLAVNAAQALGQFPLSVEGIDFLCGASHKWLMGGFGVGVFFARRALWADGLPMAGWLSTERPMEMDGFAGARRTAGQGGFEAEGAVFRQETSALELGVGAFATVLGLGAALELLEGVGLEVIERHNQALQRKLREGLRGRGFRPNIPDDPKRVAGICVVPIQGPPAEAVAKLQARGVVSTARGGGLRLATHVFNEERDVDALFEALDASGVTGDCP